MPLSVSDRSAEGQDERSFDYYQTCDLNVDENNENKEHVKDLIEQYS